VGGCSVGALQAPIAPVDGTTG